jgi:4-hydroxy-tetrahydrodipicolinate reductase
VEPALAYAPGIRLALDAARDARGVVVGLDSLIDIGIGRGARTPAPQPPVDEGGVPGQVARTTSA